VRVFDWICGALLTPPDDGTEVFEHDLDEEVRPGEADAPFETFMNGRAKAERDPHPSNDAVSPR
jgi:hypothetical protein